MEIRLEPGKYVVAVSGGVDSVVLLDLLCKESGLRLAIAHLDHGIRKDSAEDRKFVEGLAKHYGLPFHYEEAKLGPKAGEALAREARYAFLRGVKSETGADAIITAHHEDDVLETMIINIMRGTGRKGLSSLSSKDDIVRPLLGFSKQDIIGYAKSHKLDWHEDSSNADQAYLRNHIRHSILTKLTPAQKKSLLNIYEKSLPLNEEIDRLVVELFLRVDSLPRSIFNSLEHKLACEVVAAWLRKEKVPFSKPAVDKIVIRLKAGRENKRIDAGRGRYFSVSKSSIRLNR
ncbi:MAG TPA: tRNA lysidine(34) synthetase TilS [Candidatus Saccharimonadales bacterium]|nr:tRNA lysidine(34) synthetase TilS [Candidatus Saccharimonadales bacterium]